MTKHDGNTTKESLNKFLQKALDEHEREIERIRNPIIYMNAIEYEKMQKAKKLGLKSFNSTTGRIVFEVLDDD